jgi:hypothetical protein
MINKKQNKTQLQSFSLDSPRLHWSLSFNGNPILSLGKPKTPDSSFLDSLYPTSTNSDFSIPLLLPQYSVPPSPRLDHYNSLLSLLLPYFASLLLFKHTRHAPIYKSIDLLVVIG